MAPSSLIWKLAVASISLSMSGSLSVYAQPQPTTSSTASAPTLACPGANEQTYTDSHGIQYIIGCGSDTTNGNYDVVDIPSNGSFVDCFNYCSTNYGSTSNCTAFSFSGNTESGAGSGQCFLKSFTTEQFSQGTNDQVAAIRRQNYAVGLYTPGDSTMPATSTSTSTTSTSSQSTATPVACPQGNGQLYTDPYGRQYAIGCNALAGGYIYANVEISSNASIMDCFDYCSNNYELPSGSCTAFTFVEATQMDGETAYCQLENSTHPTFIYGYNDEIAAIWNPAITTTTTSMPTSSSSTVTSSSSSPTVSPTTLSCSGSEEYSWTAPSGVQYIISCGGAVSGSSYYTLQLPSDEGWQDCLDYCAQNYSQPVGGCTGMTYQNNNGASYNVTGGSCYLNNDTSEFLLPYDNVYSVGAIRMQNYTPPTSTSVSSSSYSTTASPSPTCSCGQYTDTNNMAYTIQCNSGVSGHLTSAGGSFTIGNYTNCPPYCDRTDGCSGWIWHPNPGTDGDGGDCDLYSGQLSFTTTGYNGDTAGILGNVPINSTICSPATTTSQSAASSFTISTSPSASCSSGPYADTNGRYYIIQCNASTTTGNTNVGSSTFGSGNYTQCMPACDGTSLCNGWTWDPYQIGGGVCTFTSGETAFSVANGLVGGREAAIPRPYSSTTSSAPSATTTTSQSTVTSATVSISPSATCSPGPYTDTNGISYTIQCDSDTSMGASSSQIFNSGYYTQCMPICDGTSGCSAWSWVPYADGGGICYFKTGQNTFSSGSAGEVAGILAGSSPTTATSSVSSSTMSGQAIGGSATTATSPSGSQTGSHSTASSSTISYQTSSQPSISSATSSSSSASPTISAVASCPGSNGQTVTDSAGVSYQIACDSDTSGGNYDVYDVQNGFNDCFAYCDNSIALNTMICTAWTYAGGVNGVGPGQCFVKNGAGTTFVPASGIYVGAIHVASTNSSTSTGSTGSTGGSATSISGMSSQTATISTSSSTGSSMNSMSGANSQSNTMSSSTGGSMTPISGTSSQTNTMSMSSTAGGSTTAMSGMTGQRSTISMSSTSSSPSPSVITCQNNTQITAANGQQYTIYCDANTDNSGGGAFAQQIYGSGDFTQCNTACGATTGCGAWVWVPYAPGDGGVCYLKSLPQNYTPGSAGEVAGIMVITQSTGMSSTGSSLGSTATSGATMSTQIHTTSSSASPSPSVYGPQCPGANGTTYSDPSGAQYMVLCNTNTNPGAVGSVIEPDFGHCIDACSQQTAPACVAVTYSGTSCYFKSQYQGDAPGTGVQAAVLLSQLNVGSSGSSSSSGQPNSMTTPSRSSTTVMSSPLSGLTAISTAPSTQPGSTSASTGAHSSGQATSSNGKGSQSSSPMTSSNPARSPGMTSTMAPVSSSTMSSSSMMTGGISGSVVSGGTPTGSILTSGAISSMTTGSISTANTNPTGTSSMNMMTSGSMSTGNPNPTGATSMNSNSMSMSIGVQSPTTASLSQSNPGSPFSAMQMSASSSLPACPSTTGTQPSNGTMCIDANRNPYNVTYGEVYTGTINRETAASNLDSCLTLCDASPGCEAVNYIGGECQFLTQITGSSTAAGGAAAIRPPGVSTVYTAPPSMTASPTVATNAPVSKGASTTASSGSAGMTESPVGQSMPGAPGSSTIIATSNAQPSSGTSGFGGGSSGNTQGSNTPTNSGSNSNMLSGTMIKGTTYQSTNGNVPTTQVTMANPFYTPSSSMSSVASGGSGGPGPVSGSNNGITSGMASTPTGGQSQTGSGSIKSNDNQASVSATTTSSPPASTGPVCPNYDQEDYYDQTGGTYNVDCNATYDGDIIYSGNSTSTTSTKQKRASIPWTSELCMDACDQNTQCVAIIYEECEHICTLLGDIVSGQVPSSSFCGFSAKKVNGPANNGGGGGTGPSNSGTSVVTVTVSVCAAKTTRTTTMFSTHWLRTCPGNAKCTSAGGASW